MLQGGAFQKLHGQEGMALVLADFVKGADVGMIEGGRGAGFALEAFQGHAVAGHLLRKEFEGDFAAEFQVFGTIDDAHAATAEFLHDAVVGDGFTGRHRCSIMPQYRGTRRNRRVIQLAVNRRL